MANTNTTIVDFETMSNIPATYVGYIKEQRGMSLAMEFVPDMYRVVFNTIATLLKYNRNKNTPHIGFKLMNDAGEFRFGAILDFHAPEGEEDDTGNWSLSFTFNEKDMDGINPIYDNFSDMFYTMSEHEVRSTMNGYLDDRKAATFLFVAAIEVLRIQLDNISNDGNDVEIQMPGIFMAGVGFENGEKCFYAVPGSNIKQLIKDDKGLSKESLPKAA